MRKLPAIIILFYLLTAPGCSILENLKSTPSQIDVVTITGSAATDLGQVLVFARETNNKEIMFFKEFFTPGKGAPYMHRQMRRYRQKIERLKNRRVTVTSHENRAGNREIDKIDRQ